MAELRYGLREGMGKGKEYPVAASQYFHRRGGHFVGLNAAGDAVICSRSASQVLGWLQAPKDTSGYNTWLSNATAKTDDCFVITGLDNVFEVPWDQTVASLTATHMGRGCMATLTAATYTQVQKVQYYATAASTLFSVVGMDLTNKTVLVAMRPAMKQNA